MILFEPKYRATLDLNQAVYRKSFNLKFVMERWGTLDRTIYIWMLDVLYFLKKLLPCQEKQRAF